MTLADALLTFLVGLILVATFCWNVLLFCLALAAGGYAIYIQETRRQVVNHYHCPIGDEGDEGDFFRDDQSIECENDPGFEDDDANGGGGGRE